jgi:hypothetical protein
MGTARLADAMVETIELFTRRPVEAQEMSTSPCAKKGSCNSEECPLQNKDF